MTPKSSYPVNILASQAQLAKEGAEEVRLAGRIMLWRKFGGLVFGQLQDRSGRIQVSLRRDQLGVERFKEWAGMISLGDIVGVTGRLYTTERGERTVEVSELALLNKALRPMPDKWQGISDTEVRYRKRYLDLLATPESRERFLLRARLIAQIRSFLDQAGFLEVETPILQDAAAGASARPFVTHHQALDQDFYLRISPETYLKRAVAGSLERVYELGRNFRNEGIDPSHLQEFTMLEWYAAYWDYRDNMRMIRELILVLLDEVVGSRVITHGGVELDFGAEWPEIDYFEAVEQHSGISLNKLRDFSSLRAEVERRHPQLDLSGQVSYAGVVDLLYKKTVRPHLVQPCYLLRHPAEMVPLARRSDDDPSRLDMFQVVVRGWEIVKAYSELVDAKEQRARLEEQVQLRQAGDEETMMLEEDFLECMEHGMPPMSGLGLGIDRLVALLTDAPTLRDVVLFPQMHHRQDKSAASASASDLS